MLLPFPFLSRTVRLTFPGFGQMGKHCVAALTFCGNHRSSFSVPHKHEERKIFLFICNRTSSKGPVATVVLSGLFAQRQLLSFGQQGQEGKQFEKKAIDETWRPGLSPRFREDQDL